MRGKLEKWRWVGFVFWDQARVELVKSQLPVYSTGWLTIAPPPDRVRLSSEGPAAAAALED